MLSSSSSASLLFMPAIWESRGWVVRLQCAPPRSPSVVTSWERPSGWGSHQWWSWRKTGKEGKRRSRPIVRKKGRLSDGEAAPAESASTAADTSSAPPQRHFDAWQLQNKWRRLCDWPYFTSEGGSNVNTAAVSTGSSLAVPSVCTHGAMFYQAGPFTRIYAYVCDIRGCFHLQRAHVCVCVFARRPDLKRHLQYLWLREEFGISWERPPPPAVWCISAKRGEHLRLYVS